MDSLSPTDWSAVLHRCRQTLNELRSGSVDRERSTTECLKILYRAYRGICLSSNFYSHYGNGLKISGWECGDCACPAAWTRVDSLKQSQPLPGGGILFPEEGGRAESKINRVKDGPGMKIRGWGDCCNMAKQLIREDPRNASGDRSPIHHPSLDDPDAWEYPAEDALKDESCAFFTMAMSEEAGLLRRVVHRLPSEMQTIVTMKYFAGATQKEIALELGRAESYVSQQIPKIAARLRELLQEEGLQSGDFNR